MTRVETPRVGRTWSPRPDAGHTFEKLVSVEKRFGESDGDFLLRKIANLRAAIGQIQSGAAELRNRIGQLEEQDERNRMILRRMAPRHDPQQTDDLVARFAALSQDDQSLALAKLAQSRQSSAN